MSIELMEGIILKDFINYLNIKDKQISPRTKQRYISDIKYYVNKYINSSNLIDDFDNFFTPIIVKAFLSTRRSSTARATLINFINFLREYRRLEDTKYIETIDFLKSLKKTKLERQMEFLNDDQLSFLLNGRIKFNKKDQDARFVLPLLLYLSYHLIFEQDHLIKLKWSDIELENKRIKNLRSEIENTATKWIYIEDNLCEFITAYQGNNSNKRELFFMYDGQPLNNTKINSLLGILKRRSNIDILKSTVDMQKLNRSRILKDLIDTEGKSTIEHIKILGLNRNTQLEHALEEYLLNVYSKMPSDI